MINRDGGVSNWDLLEQNGYNISELKKQIKCDKCEGSLVEEGEFFCDQTGGFQTEVLDRSRNPQENLLKNYAFSHFKCCSCKC